MANPLTGDYEAVVQVATRQINGLLGTLHQKGFDPNAKLKLLHSTATRIGDPPPRRPPDVAVFGDWLIQYYHRARPGRGLRDVRAELAATAPPGAAKLLTDAYAGFDRDWVISYPPDPTVIRGLAKIQVASVTITVPPGSSSEVTIHANVRAHYYPDSGTTALPAPVHGDVHAAFAVIKEAAPSGGQRLRIQASSDNSKIQFVTAPGTGLSTADQSKIAAEIRKVLRAGTTLLPVGLSADFPFTDFKGLGSGAGQIIALPLQLSGAALPASGVSSLTQSFIGTSGFAFAASKEFVSGRFDIEAIRQAIRNRTITLRIGRWGVYYDVVYHLRFSEGPTLTFKSGGIEVSGKVEVETGTWWAPNGWVKFKSLVRLALNTASQTISLQRVGEPDVEVEFPPTHSRGLNIVRSEIDNALSANTARMRGIFNDAKSRLLNGLRNFDTAATVSFTGIEITPDGVIVRGNIGSGLRRGTIVKIAETHGGTAFTAFESWIPAGRIDRFIWSWVEHSGLHDTAWGGTAKSLTDQHRFILPKPEGISQISQICLRIEGTRTQTSGNETSAGGGTICEVSEPEVLLNVPVWWGPVTVPIWRPDAANAASLREAIAGHVSVQSDTPGQQPSSQNTLVYFPDWRSAKPLDALSTALSRVKSKAGLMVIVVLPVGAFDSPRKEFEAKLPKESQHINAPVQFTEDDEGGWTRMFGVARTPSIYLINARRQFVWKQEGEPDPAALAAALEQHLVKSTPASGFRPLRLAVLPGELAPSAFFVDDRREEFSVRRLRGRNVLFNFWQSWSAPCIAELGRLQRLHQAGAEAPFIAAFHGGKDGKVLDEIRKRLKLSFPLVQDSEQRIARQYGVRCWPTTIRIDADRHVEHVQFGAEHEHPKDHVKDPGHEQTKPAKARA